MTEFYLPKKLPAYRLRLQAHYSNEDNKLLRDLIGNSYAYVVEETTYDNWNGGADGHDVLLFLQMEELSKVDINNIDNVTQQICEDLNKVSRGIENEFFANVRLELFDENDEKCQRAKPIRSRPDPDADTLSIWKQGTVRLFISHRDKHKAKANELAEALEPYGISSFVAHDSIEPMTTWKNEIIKGLETMEIMLAFVTDDFHKSIWTDQEIGFALGRDIPIVSLKLQGQDPSGFISEKQALKCSYDNVVEIIPKLYELLAGKLVDRERLQTSLIRAFIDSPSFIETEERFDRMNEVVFELSDAEIADIVEGFRENYQIRQAYYLTRNERLIRFLDRATGKSFVINGKNISVEGDDTEDDLPF